MPVSLNCSRMLLPQLCVILVSLVAVVSSDNFVIAGVKIVSRSSEIGVINGSFFDLILDVSPGVYTYPEGCGSVCQVNAFQSAVGETLFTVPSVGSPVLCRVEGPCRYLEVTTSSAGSLDPFASWSNSPQRIFLQSKVVGSTVYVVAASEKDNGNLLVHLGVIMGRSYDSMEVTYSENAVDLRLSSLSALHVSMPWVSAGGDRAALVLGSPSKLAFYHLVDSNSTAAMAHLNNMNLERFVSWKLPLAARDAEACASFSELIPNVVENSLLLVCAGNQMFLAIHCQFRFFEGCVGGSSLIYASDTIQTPPLLLLFKQTRETTAMTFIQLTPHGRMVAKRSRSMSVFNNFEVTVLSNEPVKSVSPPFYPPEGRNQVSFFTAVVNKDDKRCIFQVSITGERPVLTKVSACPSESVHCIVIGEASDHLLVGDMSTNSTWIYSVKGNHWQFMLYSAPSNPILQATSKSVAVSGVSPDPTRNPNAAESAPSPPMPWMASATSLAPTVVGMVIVLVVPVVAVLVFRHYRKKNQRRGPQLSSNEVSTVDTVSEILTPVEEFSRPVSELELEEQLYQLQPQHIAFPNAQLPSPAEVVVAYPQPIGVLLEVSLDQQASRNNSEDEPVISDDEADDNGHDVNRREGRLLSVRSSTSSTVPYSVEEHGERRNQPRFDIDVPLGLVNGGEELVTPSVR